MSRIILALALACSASAFMVPAKVPRMPMTVRSSMMASSTKTNTDVPASAYPGIKMPYGTGLTDENKMLAVDLEVDKFAVEGALVWGEILLTGTLKSDPSGFDTLQKVVTKNSNHAKELPPGYKHFGGSDFAAQLCVILENNPFYAASLTPRAGGGFEIINCDPIGKASTYSARVMRTIGRNGPRVNVKFSVKPEGGLTIDGFDVFENGEKVEKTEDDDYYASAVLFDLFFVSESLHATIHMFHYALTNALAYASEDFGQLNKWAEEYNGNVNNKYNQVTTVLVKKNSGIITSSKRLGGNNHVRSIIQDNMATWGACSTGSEFYDNWFQSPRKDLEAAGLLTEHFKQSDLGVACAISATAALEKKEGKLDKTNEKLVDYLSKSGAWPAEENGIKTVRSLLDMMMITGVIHGATLSFTRLSCKPEIFRWRDITEPKWTKDDLATSLVACGTTIGVQKDKVVCGNKKLPKTLEKELLEKVCTGEIQEEDVTGGALQKVLDTYDRETTALKTIYQEKIQKREDFDNVGFLLTDYCTDLYDGKQLTLATYV